MTDWSEDGILVQRANTPFDHDLFLVDPESGALTHLTPHDGEVSYDSARLLPDGAVLCACDAGSEFTRLALLRQGAEPEFLTADDADVEIVALDASRTRRAWVVNRGGESEVWLDGERVEGLPGGVVSALAFAPDGSLDRHGRPARRLDRRLERRARRAPHPLGGRRARPLGHSCGRCSTRSRASTAAASRTSASARRAAPRCAGCTAGPSRSSGRRWRR